MPKFIIGKNVKISILALSVSLLLAVLFAILKLSPVVLVLLLVVSLLLVFVTVALLLKSQNHFIALIQDTLKQFANGKFSLSSELMNEPSFQELLPSLQDFVSNMQKNENILSQAAMGNFSLAVQAHSEHDEMNKAISKMIANNSEMISLIRSTSLQLAQGAEKIAVMAQNLADGSQEQSDTIQEITTVVTEISAMAENNLTTASLTEKEVQQTAVVMDECAKEMSEMLTAMAEMDSNAQGISKVMKVIEDIAFQTNILALNASVEAARAGQHGKGFAVVADEVRNLAAKSATASKETGELIERSIASVEKSSKIVNKVNNRILEVGKIADKNAVSIQEIKNASQKQSNSMAEVASSIASLSSVVQASALSAQDSALTSSEILSQSSVLDQIVARFQLYGEENKTTQKAYELTPDLLVGHPLIDSQHKELIEAINRLLDACATGQGREAINNTIQFLIDYTAKHFGEEEVLQKKYGYPDRVNHHKMHEKFKADVAEIGKRIDMEGPTIELIGKVNSMIAGWLLQHIKSQDTKVAAHIRANGGLHT